MIGADEDLGDEIRQQLIAPELQAERHHNVDAMVDVLADIRGWIAVDSWIGGGKINKTTRTSTMTPTLRFARSPP